MSELWIEEWKSDGAFVELGAHFEGKKSRQRLWYRVESERKAELTTLADPFLLGMLMIAMNDGDEMRVHGTVSPSLLRNLDDFQRAWVAWRPDYYRVISIRADQEKEFNAASRNEAICCFSGGVDSCFTAYRHARGVETRFPYPLRTAVLIHGFDIPLKEVAYYESAFEKVNCQLNSIGIGLYRVATNFKEISVYWPHNHGSGVASVLSLFQGRYSTGLIAQGVPYGSYHNLPSAGSNPMTDPLLSSDSFKIVPDGGGHERFEKIQAISGWPEGLAHLRVCWEGEKKDSNCCDCEKCIRNILTFRALRLPLPSAFSIDPDERRIYRLGPIKEHSISIGYNSILELARQNGLEDAGWVKALKKAIFRSRAMRKLSRHAPGRMALWLIRRFFPAWRQPLVINKF